MLNRRSMLRGAGQALALVLPAAAVAASPLPQATPSLTPAQPDAIDCLVTEFIRQIEVNHVTVRLEYGRRRSGKCSLAFVEPADNKKGNRITAVLASFSMLSAVPGARERFIEACERIASRSSWIGVA